MVDEDAMENPESRLMACAWNGVVDQLAACLKAGERCDDYSMSGNSAWTYVDINNNKLLNVMCSLRLLHLFGHNPHEFADQGGLPIYQRARLHHDWALLRFCFDMGWASTPSREEVMRESMEEEEEEDDPPAPADELQLQLDAMYRSEGLDPTQRIRVSLSDTSHTRRLKIMHNNLLTREQEVREMAKLDEEIQRDGLLCDYARDARCSEEHVLALLKKPLALDVLDRKISVRHFTQVVSCS